MGFVGGGAGWLQVFVESTASAAVGVARELSGRAAFSCEQPPLVRFRRSVQRAACSVSGSDSGLALVVSGRG